MAVIVVASLVRLVPTSVARPFWSIVATATLLDDQARLFVRFCVGPPGVNVPSAMNCVVSPWNVAVAPVGTIVIVAAEELVPIFTVSVAVLLMPPDCAMMVVVPEPTAVARPDELIVATCAFDEIQVTWLFRFCEAPPVRLPAASN